MSGVAPVAPVEHLTALSPAPVGGRRHSKKLRLVKKKTVKRMLKKMGLKMRGGAPEDPASVSEEPETTDGGRRRRRGSKKSRKTRRKSLFGLKY